MFLPKKNCERFYKHKKSLYLHLRHSVAKGSKGGNAARVVIVTESGTPYDVIASIRMHNKITGTLQAVNEYLV